MVGDLLESTRVEAGHIELRTEYVDLRAVAREAVELFREGSPLHDLLLDEPDDELPTRCDRLRIEWALNNLISNAIKSSPQGGPVVVKAVQVDEWAVLSVSDEGLGIAEAELPLLWEPFRRTDTSTGLVPGLGLSLFTSKRIAQAHGGDIIVTSTPGQGSTFSLRLPLAARARLPVRPAREHTSELPGSLH